MAFSLHKGIWTAIAAGLQIIALILLLIGIGVPNWMNKGQVEAGLFQTCDSRLPKGMECSDAMDNNMMGGAQMCAKVQLALSLILCGFTTFFAVCYFAGKHQLFLSPLFLQTLHFAAIVMAYISTVYGLIGAILATYCMNEMMEPMGFSVGGAMIVYWLNLPFSLACMIVLILAQLFSPSEE